MAETHTIYTALLEFQKSVKKVKKTEQGYGYSYADLEQVMDTVRESLNENGLVLIQTTDGSHLVTQLIHAATGEKIESRTELTQLIGDAGKGSKAQAYGSAVTYARRYEILTILGLAPSDDDGAQAGNSQTQQKQQTPFDPQNPAHKKRVKEMVTQEKKDAESVISEITAKGFRISEENKKWIRNIAVAEQEKQQEDEQIVNDVQI